MAKETLKSLLEKAQPEMKPLIKAGWKALRKAQGPVEIVQTYNSYTGTRNLEWVSDDAKAVSESFWASKAPPGGSHVEAFLRLATVDAGKALGFQVFDTGFTSLSNLDAKGDYRRSLTLRRPEKKPTRASRFDVVGGPF